MGTNGDYKAFLKTKASESRESGIEVSKLDLNRNLFPWQADIVHWALKVGRAALFQDCGTGKTIEQLAWAEQIARRTEYVLILTPLAVAEQTKEEATRFEIGVPVKIVKHAEEVEKGINITNYERLHLFNCGMFGGVVLDESSVLKSFTGTTKKMLCELFAKTPFRLACTATPAPNDHMELGNHADFLGVMPSNEMLSRWFINDTMKAGGYRLMMHAVKDFWRWVSSWAVSVQKPSDLGYDDGAFILPPLNIHEHVVDTEDVEPPGGFLFSKGGLSATTMHAEKRTTAQRRAARVAELVGSNQEAWLVWCDTNYEADALMEVLPDAVEVRGNDSEDVRRDRMLGFIEGRYRVLITKPEIGGFGLNLQHCCHVAYVGVSYSYERFYQSVRRCWRFGQKRPVECHIVNAESEQALWKAVMAKASAHEAIKAGMVDAMREDMLERLYGKRERVSYEPQITMAKPRWLQRRVSA